MWINQTLLEIVHCSEINYWKFTYTIPPLSISPSLSLYDLLNNLLSQNVYRISNVDFLEIEIVNSFTTSLTLTNIYEFLHIPPSNKSSYIVNIEFVFASHRFCKDRYILIVRNSYQNTNFVNLSEVTNSVGYNLYIVSDDFYISRIFIYLYFYYLYNSRIIFHVRIDIYIVFHYVISSHWVHIVYIIALNNNLAKLHEMYKTNNKNGLFTSFMTLFRVRILFKKRIKKCEIIL